MIGRLIIGGIFVIAGTAILFSTLHAHDVGEVAGLGRYGGNYSIDENPALFHFHLYFWYVFSVLSFFYGLYLIFIGPQKKN